jgi:hypothetical protein
MMIAVPRTHWLASRPGVRLKDLVGESWIGPDATDDDDILGPARLPAADGEPSPLP